MTREETQKILAVISASFPTFKVEDKTATINAWTLMLEEYSYQQVAMALKTYISTNNTAFAPSIAQLIAMCHKPKELKEMSELAAWNVVSKAIRRANYYAEEEFEKMPVEIQNALGSPSQLRIWASDPNFNESVVSSNFMRTYRAVINRSHWENRLPYDVRMALETEKINQIEEKRDGR